MTLSKLPEGGDRVHSLECLRAPGGHVLVEVDERVLACREAVGELHLLEGGDVRRPELGPFEGERRRRCVVTGAGLAEVCTELGAGRALLDRDQVEAVWTRTEVPYRKRPRSRQLASTRVVDPANTNNVLSDDLTKQEKDRIASSATHAAQQQYWEKILW